MSLLKDLNEKLMIELNKLSLLQGDPTKILEKRLAISQFALTIPTHQRVFCFGNWQGPTWHGPCVLVYDSYSENLFCYAVVDDDNKINLVDLHHFYSAVPHEALLREAFLEEDTSVQIVKDNES